MIGQLVRSVFCVLLVSVGLQAQDSERVFREREINSEIDLSEYDIFEPFGFDVSTNGELFIYDRGYGAVIAIDPADASQKIYGQGRGEGPGQVAEPTDLSVDSKGNIWLTDPGLVRVTIWKPGGEIDRIISFDDASFGVKASEFRDGYVYQTNGYSLGEVLVYQNGEEDIAMGDFVNRPGSVSWVTDGWLSTNDEAVFFAGYYSNFLVSFDQEGSFRFQTRFIEDLEDIDILSKEYSESELRESNKKLDGVKILGLTVVKPDQQRNRMALALEAASDDLYVLFEGDTSEKNKIVDVYSAENGEYRYSFLLDYPGTDLAYHNQMVYVLSYDGEEYKVISYE